MIEKCNFRRVCICGYFQRKSIALHDISSVFVYRVGQLPLVGYDLVESKTMMVEN